MRGLVSLNCQIADPSLATIPASAAAGLYGKGIFTTIAIYEGDPFLWDKHWTRLKENSARVGIDLGEFSEAAILEALQDLVVANSIQTGRARITFSDESATALWPYDNKQKTSVLIMTAPFQPVAENFKITLSPHRINSTSPLAGVKSCNYLDKIIAKEESKQRGFDEAIQLNEHHQIASACTANVFWLRDEKLYTPSRKTGCLGGTTRGFVLENIDCEEVEAEIDDLKLADEIFLTSAGIGIVQIAEFEGRKLRSGDHAIMDLLPSRS